MEDADLDEAAAKGVDMTKSVRPLRIEVRGQMVRAICPCCPRRGPWHADFAGTYYPSKVARARHAFQMAHVARHS